MKPEIKFVLPLLRDVKPQKGEFVRVLFPSAIPYEKVDQPRVSVHKAEPPEPKRVIEKVTEILNLGVVPVMMFRGREPRFYHWNPDSQTLLRTKQPQEEFKAWLQRIESDNRGPRWDSEVQVKLRNYKFAMPPILKRFSQDVVVAKNITKAVMHCIQIATIFPPDHTLSVQAWKILEAMHYMRFEFGEEQPWESCFPLGLRADAELESERERDAFVTYYREQAVHIKCPYLARLFEAFAVACWEQNGYKYPPLFFGIRARRTKHADFRFYVESKSKETTE